MLSFIFSDLKLGHYEFQIHAYDEHILNDYEKSEEHIQGKSYLESYYSSVQLGTGMTTIFHIVI